MSEIVYNKNGVAFDIDAIATDLNGKMDVDGVNSTCSVCVESYHDNNGNWYRVYSDGWCEQGGVSTFTAVSQKQIDLVFLKSFTDTNYNISSTIITNTNNNVYTFIGIYGKSESTARIVLNVYNNSATQIVGCDWEAKGYIR